MDWPLASVTTGDGTDRPETFVLKSYFEKSTTMSRQPSKNRRQCDAQHGDIDIALGRLDQDAGPPGTAEAEDREDVEAALELRLDGRRDNVALLYLLALISVADHLGDGPVRLDRDDRGFADVLGTGSGPENEQLVAGDEAVVGPDRQFDTAVAWDRCASLHPERAAGSRVP